MSEPAFVCVWYVGRRITPDFSSAVVRHPPDISEVGLKEDESITFIRLKSQPLAPWLTSCSTKTILPANRVSVSVDQPEYSPTYVTLVNKVIWEKASALLALTIRSAQSYTI